jgi:hypothetical protein
LKIRGKDRWQIAKVRRNLFVGNRKTTITIIGAVAERAATR